MLILSLLTIPLGVSAVHNHARQASSAAPTSSASGLGAGNPASAPPLSTTVSNTVTPTFISTNPTAEALTNIIATPKTDPTYAVYTTYAPGATPPVSGAPPLPSGVIVAADWPALDHVPPIDSPQVTQWMTELDGFVIPDISVTNPGGCPANPSIVGNATRCWWTCGHCTRDTDITTCPDKMTWGVSYDDGPSPYTPALLNYLNSESLKATFFVVGSRAISRPTILQDEYMAGHQVCVHTWSHPYLTTLTTEEVVAELGWTRQAMRDIIGVSPNCMRPPYGDIDDRIRAISLAMGMTPIIWSTYNGTDYDTNDWYIPAGTVTAADVLGTFDQVLFVDAPMMNSGFIVLEHDLYQQTVDLAVGYVLPNALASKKFQMMPIISCLNKPIEDSYVETNNNVTNPPETATYVSAGGSTGLAVPTGGQSSPAGSGSGSGGGSSSAAVVERAVHMAVLCAGLALGAAAVTLL